MIQPCPTSLKPPRSLWAGLIACLAVLVSCEDNSTPSPPAPAAVAAPTDLPAVTPSLIDLLGQPQSVLLGRGKPELTVSGFVVSPTLETETSFVAPPATDLSFVALHTERPKAQGSLEVTAQLGDETLSLGVFETRSLDSLQGADRWELLDQAEVIDLSALAGRRMQLAWHFSPATGDANDTVSTGMVAVPRLVPQVAAAQRPPHVLLICSDTHRTDYSVGGEHAELMPQLAAATTTAVNYSSAYATASWTLPSITSTLTGLPPRYHNTGFRADSRESGSDEPVPPGYFVRPHAGQDVLHTTFSRQLKTLPEQLREQGYATGMVVSNPLYHTSGMFRDGGDVVARTGVVNGSTVTEHALAVLQGMDRTRPTFLLVHYLDVHQWKPWYFDKEHPGLERSEFSEADVKASYHQSVKDTDAAIGELLQGWDDALGLDQSLVVFYSDHGESLMDKSRATGHGNSMLEELLHVPLLVRYPSSLPSRPLIDGRSASLMDIYPTVLDVAGLPPADLGPAGGHSLLGEPISERLLFADFQLFNDELSAVRLGPHKLTLNLTENKRQLVDTSLERTGAFEVSLEDADLERTLAERFSRYRDEGLAFSQTLIADFQSDAASAEQDLRQLGYLR